MGNKVYLTNEGFLEIEEELNHLKEVKRPEVIKALKDARALGDLSENADYDAARNEQAQIEGRILELEKILETAEIIEKRDTDKVGLFSIISAVSSIFSSSSILPSICACSFLAAS